MSDVSTAAHDLVANVARTATAYRDVADQFAELSRRNEEMFRGPAWADVSQEVQTLREIVDRRTPGSIGAANESTRRDLIVELLRNALEGYYNLELRVATLPQRVKLICGLLSASLPLLFQMRATHQHELVHAREQAGHARTHREQQQLLRQQAESIAMLTATLAGLREQLAIIPDVRLRVTRRTTLRQEGPSGATAVVITLRTGQRVRLLTAFERWRYVEVPLEERNIGQHPRLAVSAQCVF